MKVIQLDNTDAAPLEVSDKLTGAEFKPYIIRDAVVYQQAKERQGTHATKTRHFVAGSTRKLFKQKGTGRARPGDIKGPHRRGGGIAHGPHPRSHAIGMNKKVRKAALVSALSEKIRRNETLVVDNLELKSHKTKDFASWLAKQDLTKVLIVVSDVPDNLILAVGNLPDVEMIHYTQLNVYHLLRYPKTLFTRGALEQVQERLVG